MYFWVVAEGKKAAITSSSVPCPWLPCEDVLVLWSKGAVKETFVGGETITSFLCLIPWQPHCSQGCGSDPSQLLRRQQILSNFLPSKYKAKIFIHINSAIFLCILICELPWKSWSCKSVPSVHSRKCQKAVYSQFHVRLFVLLSKLSLTCEHMCPQSYWFSTQSTCLNAWIVFKSRH